MINFNYQKAYCVQVVPAFNSLPHHVKDIHSKVRAIIGDLNQVKDLTIPMTPAIRCYLNDLTTRELAELSRVSYYAGHCQPGLLSRLFDSSRGEGWKISNCCDQLLRERLKPPYNIQIHEGKLRVTFSNKECWLWDEFALATEENLETFKNCKLKFGEETLHKNAKRLASQIGDLWPDVDNMPDNDLYRDFLKLSREKHKQAILDQFEDKIKQLERDKVNAQIEINFLLACNELNIDTNNLIYYHHIKTFCFGWREKLSEGERYNIEEKLATVNHGHIIDYKMRS